MEEQRVTLDLGGQTLNISTGKWAKLAGGSAVVQLGGTVVLVAASASTDTTAPKSTITSLAVTLRIVPCRTSPSAGGAK